MRSHKFLAGAVTGIALVVLASGIFLSGIGRQPADAAGGKTDAAKTALATPGAGAAPSIDQANQLEQRMMLSISDAEWGAAASALGMTQADFTSAINGGQSVTSLGAPQQLSAAQVCTVMTSAGTVAVNAAVQNGTITQPQADFLNRGLVTAIANKVTSANSDASTSGSTPGIENTIASAELSAMASILGVPLDQLKPALDNPTQLATLVAAQQVTVQQLQAALVAAGQQALDQAVANGTVSQSDADGLRSGLVQSMAEKLSHVVGTAAP